MGPCLLGRKRRLGRVAAPVRRRVERPHDVVRRGLGGHSRVPEGRADDRCPRELRVRAAGHQRAEDPVAREVRFGPVGPVEDDRFRRAGLARDDEASRRSRRSARRKGTRAGSGTTFTSSSFTRGKSPYPGRSSRMQVASFAAADVSSEAQASGASLALRARRTIFCRRSSSVRMPRAIARVARRRVSARTYAVREPRNARATTAASARTTSAAATRTRRSRTARANAAVTAECRFLVRRCTASTALSRTVPPGNRQ
jgi:hypothetical protein